MRKLLIVVSSALLLAACAEVRKPVPELLFSFCDYPELEHSHNLQGCAVYGDLLFSMQDKGWCNVFGHR